MFRAAFRKFLEKEAYPHYNDWEKRGIIPRSFWAKMGENGFLCPWVDEAYGGLNADFAYSVVINEELEKVGSSLVGIGLHNDIVTPYIASYGTEEQKQKWLPKCVSGELITAIAMTEPGAGSDLANISTTAIKDGRRTRPSPAARRPRRRVDRKLPARGDGAAWARLRRRAPRQRTDHLLLDQRLWPTERALAARKP